MQRVESKGTVFSARDALGPSQRMRQRHRPGVLRGGNAASDDDEDNDVDGLGATTPRDKAPTHTIRLYPRVTITDRDRKAFHVFDHFSVGELGMWRVFGLRYLRERLNSARCCRLTVVLLLLLAAVAQVALGMLESRQFSWLPTVTMLGFGAGAALTVMSHLKRRACDSLNTGVCQGPNGKYFPKWLAANAMALRLNALELELVDSSHSEAIRLHEAEDNAGPRGSDPPPTTERMIQIDAKESSAGTPLRATLAAAAASALEPRSAREPTIVLEESDEGQSPSPPPRKEGERGRRDRASTPTGPSPRGKIVQSPGERPSVRPEAAISGAARRASKKQRDTM
jgi:hypothetical protein